MKAAQYLSKWREIEGADSPLVRWGGIASILIILWSFVLSPYLQWHDQQGLLFSQNIRKVGKLQALQAAEKKWQQAELIYQQAEADMLTTLFQQPSYVSAQTTLLTLLRQAAKTHNLIIISQHLEESEKEPMIGQRMSITLALKGKLADLLSLIDNLSQHTKLLDIGKLAIHKGRRTTLTATLMVSGFRSTTSTE
jgi:hypothetical protein